MEYKAGTTLPPPTSDRIADFERAYRVKFPLDYVNELKAGNGGVPIQNLFDQNGRERLIERMLCVVDDPKKVGDMGWYDIGVVITQLDDRIVDDEDLIGTNVVPIAALFAGDFVCLDFRRDALNPLVVVWDHELSEELQPHFETVAKSFSAFVAMLRPGPQ